MRVARFILNSHLAITQETYQLIAEGIDIWQVSRLIEGVADDRGIELVRSSACFFKDLNNLGQADKN